MAASQTNGLSTVSSTGVLSFLAERLVAIHDALTRADIPHAFGGAIALAYCTQEPRGTRDIDVNAFVGTDRADDVLDALPSGVIVTRADRSAARREGQVRVMWEDTPIDLFFDTHEYHRRTAEAVRDVPFEGTTIPVLDCESLIVFKAMFNRTRDWGDIEAILESGADDGRAALEQLRWLLGDTDSATLRLSKLIR